MAKSAVLGCVLLLAFAYAAQKELVQDLGEVETLQDGKSPPTTLRVPTALLDTGCADRLLDDGRRCLPHLVQDTIRQ